LEAILNYDTLPYLLDKTLHNFNINDTYRVMVRQCEKDTIILGYTLQSYKNETVACMGRELLSECNNIEVVFDQEKKAAGFPFRLFLGSLGIVGILSFVWLYFFKKPASIGLLQNEANQKIIALGTLKFNHENLTVHSANKSKKLTYRENKLLYTFASQPNQVLTREQLLEDVWGDEGVMVGRSLDVFVSRLRKILSLDPNIQIKNIHGVGYRLET
jgi:DNA-binding response OmpR family regulator